MTDICPVRHLQSTTVVNALNGQQGYPITFLHFDSCIFRDIHCGSASDAILTETGCCGYNPESEFWNIFSWLNHLIRFDLDISVVNIGTQLKSYQLLISFRHINQQYRRVFEISNFRHNSTAITFKTSSFSTRNISSQ
jgi:hypothetical protein